MPSGPLVVDLTAARRVLCAYGVFALVGPRWSAQACPYRMVTGRACPACGLTRAVSAALRGDVRHSVGLHRLGPAVAVAVLGAAVATVAGAERAPRSARVHGRAPTRPTAAAPAAQPAASAAS